MFQLQRGATIGSVAGGLVSPTDCQLSAPASGMSVLVSAGELVVPGSSSATQSGYYCRISSQNTLTIAASNPSNPRIDRVVGVVADAAYSGSTNSYTTSVVTGTPTAGATLTNLNGAAAAPASSLTLGYVLVPATATNIISADILNVAPPVGLGIATVASGLVAARPAASAAKGTFFYATDTGLLYESNGTVWQTVMLAGAWTPLVPITGVSITSGGVYYTASARLEGDVVRLKGALQNNTGGSIAFGATLATVPAGMRPTNTNAQGVFGFSAGQPLYASIAPTGAISCGAAITNGNYVPLDGITYSLA